MSKGDKDLKNSCIRSQDPGASRHGNFMNYYQFHSAEERIQQLPRGVWKRPTDIIQKYVGLDVGCNAGDLTLILQEFLQEEIHDDKVDVCLIGIDLDSRLIERARESNTKPNHVSFQCMNFMGTDRDQILTDFLKKFKKTRFDVAFSFSLTMWIHLNYGDIGLMAYLEAVCKHANIIVIEPQPWRCYKNASRRLRRAGADEFVLLQSLKLKGDMTAHINDIIINKCSFRHIAETKENKWGRKLLIYERINYENAA